MHLIFVCMHVFTYLHFYQPDNPTVKILRESVGFFGAARASFLQLAHPFVAQGVRLHSSLEHGVKQRFDRTIKYMHDMQWGTKVIYSISLYSFVIFEMFNSVAIKYSCSRRVKLLQLREQCVLCTKRSMVRLTRPHPILCSALTRVSMRTR